MRAPSKLFAKRTGGSGVLITARPALPRLDRGGDEFAALLPSPVDEDLAADIGRRIIDSILIAMSLSGEVKSESQIE